jgi:hypothetical protein
MCSAMSLGFALEQQPLVEMGDDRLERADKLSYA